MSGHAPPPIPISNRVTVDLNRCGMDERPKELIDQLGINCVRYLTIHHGSVEEGNHPLRADG